MKITKLKQLIKEETRALLKEQKDPRKALAFPDKYQPCKRSNKDVAKDASRIYGVLKGIDWFNLDQPVVEKIMESYTNYECIENLYYAFDKVLSDKKDTEDGDLVRWLQDDGIDASKVINALKERSVGYRL